MAETVDKMTDFPPGEFAREQREGYSVEQKHANLTDIQKDEIVRHVQYVEEITKKLQVHGIEQPSMDYLRRKGIVKDDHYSYGKYPAAARALSGGK